MARPALSLAALLGAGAQALEEQAAQRVRPRSHAAITTTTTGRTALSMDKRLTKTSPFS
jgi:hypothetical protein